MGIRVQVMERKIRERRRRREKKKQREQGEELVRGLFFPP